MSEEAGTHQVAIDEPSSESPMPVEKAEFKEESEAVAFSAEELKDDIICHQRTEKDNPFFTALQAGFLSLKEARDTNSTPLLSPSSGQEEEANVNEADHRKNVPMNVSVSVIDPTTKPASIKSPKADNLLAKSRLASPAATPLIENVYDKMSSIFESDYGSTLRAVQYKNVRSGVSDAISSIPVQMILTRTGTASGTGEANVAWGGLAGSAATPSMDPAEWHAAPFCHVYVAACENIDHYRTKIRPSIQAFVSQLEASLGPASTKASSIMGSPSGSASTQSTSAHYLIVYVPTGGESSPEKAGKPPGGGEEGISIASGPVRRALASQFAKARTRIANYQQDMDNSAHSGESIGSADKVMTDEDTDAPSIALQMLTTSDKLIYKKMMKDFPNGKICVMSRSSLEKSAGSQSNKAMTPDDETGMVIRHQEWNTFNRMLGSVIINGFIDRCRRYNDELRRLDSQRAMAAQAIKKSLMVSPQSMSRNSNLASEFNLGYFFLVKESLAFTYEQIQLPSEALLQYDEFRAFLPDLNDVEYKKALKLRRKSKAVTSESGPPLMDLADSADFVGFRKRLRTELDLTPILEVVRRYLFAREIRLLFKMEQPVEVIARCEIFCKYQYSVMMRGIAACGEKERKDREVEASKWVIQFAWDVKTACEPFLASIGGSGGLRNQSSFDTLSLEMSGSDLPNDSGNVTESEQHIASRLGEFLEMARLLYKQLGDVELPVENILRKYDEHFPIDMLTSWNSWTCPDSSEKATQPDQQNFFQGTGRHFILDQAFTSAEAYEATYLEIISAIVQLGRYGYRRRLALRLQAELAEHLIRMKNLTAAASILKAAVKVYRWDQWDRCHFWRLFRLSYCQRTTANPTDYLKTLATCFSPRIALVAPKKALEALQDDLEKVMDHSEIGQSKYGTIAFLESFIEVVDTTSETATLGAGVDRKELVKRFCSVGELVYIKVNLVNSLPREITLDSLKLLIVDFTTFSNIVENRESIEEDDAFKTLSLDGGVILKPGTNEYNFEWAPATSGQFILSTIEVVWKKGYFYYDSMELSAPLLGVDVLPSEPSHSLTMTPAYLVPGHDQVVQITFDAGSDLVTAGILQLTCSDGISMIGPGEDLAKGEWNKDCEVKVGPLKPGEKSVLVAHVRCSFVERFSNDPISQSPSFDTAHGLKVRAFVKYLHEDTQTTEVSPTTEMKNISETFAPILEKTALSVEAINTIWMTKGERLLVSIDLMSNTPDHFSVLEWKLLLPPPLALDVDHNDHSRNCRVSDGDFVGLAFECNVSRGGEESTDTDDSVLRVILCDDNKKEFTLDLPLDLGELYLSLLGSDSPKKLGSAKAALKIDVDEGKVAEPIRLTFSVETEIEGDIAYSIDSSRTEWLLSGKVDGMLQRSGFMSLGVMGTCEIVGIPTVPGILKSFPTIKLGLVDLQGYTPLSVTFTRPESFRSMGNTQSSAVAFPINKIAV